MFILFPVPIQAMEKAIEKPAVVVKVEDDVKPSCSMEHQDGLAVVNDGEISYALITRYIFVSTMHLFAGLK